MTPMIYRVALFATLALGFTVVPISNTFAQEISDLWWYAYPYEAEAIRLGGLYSAVGRGLAAMHSSTAALGFQQGVQLQFSGGRSMKIEDAEFSTPYTIAAALPIPSWQTTVGLSLDYDEFNLERRTEDDIYGRYKYHVWNKLLGMHLAYRIKDYLSLGFVIRRYESTVESATPVLRHSSSSAIGWDLSLSAHVRHRATVINRPVDEFRYGLTIDNVLGTQIWYYDGGKKTPLHRVLRAGVAYFWNPDMGRVLNANLLSALLTVESSLQGTKHEFRDWGTVGGATELRILEVFMLSAGIENIVRLGNGYDYWPEYPVLRYGAGLDIPLDRLFKLDFLITVQIDYAHTKWNGDAEAELYWNPVDHPQQVNALSLQVKAKVF